MKSNNGCTLHDQFSLMEKILMRSGWAVLMVVGTYAIYKQDPIWAWAYVAYVLVGFVLVVAPCLCAHCPYPYQRSSCLFNPPGLQRKLYAYRGQQGSLGGKIAAFAIMAGIVVLPHFWLIKDIPLLIIFWVIGLPILAVFPLYFCKHCHYFGCPINRAKEFSGMPDGPSSQDSE